MPPTSASALVIRLDGIGDAVALTPLLAALARAGVPVDLVLRAPNAGVFSARAVGRVYLAPFELRSSTRQNLTAIARFGADLGTRGYTHVLVATEDPGGYRLAAATRAPVRVGFHNGWGKPLKTLWTRGLLTHGVYRRAGLDRRKPHECEVLFRLGAALCGETEPTRDLERLRPLIVDRELSADPRIAVQITDKWMRLGIETERVVALVRALRERYPLRLIASSAESAYAGDFARTIGGEVERFGTIEPWKDAIASAKAIVVPDSGALHLAGMVGTPVVAIFPPNPDFALQTARWAPWAAPYRIVRADDAWPALAAAALGELV